MQEKQGECFPFSTFKSKTWVQYIFHQFRRVSIWDRAFSWIKTEF